MSKFNEANNESFRRRGLCRGQRGRQNHGYSGSFSHFIESLEQIESRLDELNEKIDKINKQMETDN